MSVGCVRLFVSLKIFSYCLEKIQIKCEKSRLKCRRLVQRRVKFRIIITDIIFASRKGQRSSKTISETPQALPYNLNFDESETNICLIKENK